MVKEKIMEMIIPLMGILSATNFDWLCQILAILYIEMILFF